MTPAASLEARLLDAIGRADPSRFDPLALEVFAYQYARNRPYHAFCDRRGLAPDRIDDWRRIPPVPTTAFKVAELTCRPGEPATVLLTSGTTQGTDRRGRHLVADPTLSRAAILANAQRRLFPDLPLSGRRRILIVSLTPPPTQRPQASLIQMIDLFMQAWGAAGSRYLGTDDGLDGEALAQALDRATTDGAPVALLGTTAAFARWFARCDAGGRRVRLPEGSRLMDTGGQKGIDNGDPPSVSHAIAHRDLFLSSCERVLSLPAHAVVNEYGMTELGSQFYGSLSVGARAEETSESSRLTDPAARTDSLLLPRRSVRPPLPPHPKPAWLYTIPPWVRVRVIDPATGEEMPDGQAGLLCHYDLANLHSVMAVQTDDLGMKPPGVIDGFYLMGRVAGSAPRGCSLDSSSALLPA